LVYFQNYITLWGGKLQPEGARLEWYGKNTEKTTNIRADSKSWAAIVPCNWRVKK